MNVEHAKKNTHKIIPGMEVKVKSQKQFWQENKKRCTVLLFYLSFIIIVIVVIFFTNNIIAKFIKRSSYSQLS